MYTITWSFFSMTLYYVYMDAMMSQIYLSKPAAVTASCLKLIPEVIQWLHPCFVMLKLLINRHTHYWALMREAVFIKHDDGFVKLSLLKLIVYSFTMSMCIFTLYPSLMTGLSEQTSLSFDFINKTFLQSYNTFIFWPK